MIFAITIAIVFANWLVKGFEGRRKHKAYMEYWANAWRQHERASKALKEIEEQKKINKSIIWSFNAPQKEGQHQSPHQPH